MIVTHGVNSITHGVNSISHGAILVTRYVIWASYSYRMERAGCMCEMR